MKASKVKLRELYSYDDCIETIDAIERDWRNVVGGWDAWVSGYRTELNATSKKKIEAIWKRAERISPETFDG